MRSTLTQICRAIGSYSSSFSPCDFSCGLCCQTQQTIVSGALWWNMEVSCSTLSQTITNGHYCWYPSQGSQVCFSGIVPSGRVKKVSATLFSGPWVLSVLESQSCETGVEPESCREGVMPWRPLATQQWGSGSWLSLGKQTWLLELWPVQGQLGVSGLHRCGWR